MQNETYNLINKIPLVLFKWKSTSGGPVEFVTENVERLLGYSKSEIESSDFRYAHILHPDDIDQVVDEVVNSDIKKNDFFTHEYYRLKRSDGEYIYVKDYTQIVRNETGKVDYYLGFVFDASEMVRTETKLINDIAKYKAVFENPALSRAIVDTEGIIINPNDKFARLLGYEKEELIGKSITEITHPDFINIDLELFQQLIEGKIDAYHIEKKYITKTGDFLWAYLHVTVIRNTDGTIQWILGIIEDINDRKIAEKELQKFKLFVDNSSQGFGIADLDGNIVYTNKTLNKLGEVSSAEEIFNRHISDYYDKSSKMKIQNIVLPELFRTGNWEGELEFKSAKGKRIPTFENLFLIYNENNEPEYIADIISDISERKKYEKSLKDNVIMLESILSSIPGPVYYKNSEGRYLGCNEFFASAFKLTPKEIVGKTIFDLFPEDFAAEQHRLDKELFKSKVPQIYDTQVDVLGEQVRDVTVYKSLFPYNEHGDLAIVGIILDITKRKEAESKLISTNRSLEILSKCNMALLLAESEKELLFAFCDVLVNIGQYPIAWVSEINDDDDKNKYFLKNLAVAGIEKNLHGIFNQEDIRDKKECPMYTAGQTKKFTQITDLEKCKSCSLSNYEELKEMGINSHIIIPLTSSDSNRKVLNIYSSSAKILAEYEKALLNDIANYLSYGIDAIYEKQRRLKYEKSISTEKEELLATLRNIGEGVFTASKSGKLLQCNDKASEILEIEKDKLPGQMVYELFRVVDKNNKELLFNPFDILQAETEEAKEIHKLSIITRNNRRKIISVNISEIRDKNLSIQGIVVVFNDITEQVKNEAQQALSLKMESIGHLAAGIAHEMNTPLQYVGDNTYFLNDAIQSLFKFITAIKQEVLGSDKYPDLTAKLKKVSDDIDLDFLSEEMPVAIEGALNGLEKVSIIVKNMKNFSYSSGKKKSLDNLNHGIEVTVAISKNEWKYVAELETELSPDLPMIFCAQDEINQVILNLIINATHAIQSKFDTQEKMGLIKIVTEYDDNNVIIKVSDNGCGINPENLERVFDPFFTTKEVGKGTGQGLAISHDIIVEKHNGKIFVESEPGIGTTFILLIPREGNKDDAE